MTPYEEGFAGIAAGRRLNPTYTCESGRMNPTRERRAYWLGIRRGLRARMHLYNGTDATMMVLAEHDAARNTRPA